MPNKYTEINFPLSTIADSDSEILEWILITSLIVIFMIDSLKLSFIYLCQPDRQPIRFFGTCKCND